MSPEEQEKEAWAKLEAEGQVKRFATIEDAIKNGYTIMCNDGLFMKGGTEIPRAAYAKLFAELRDTNAANEPFSLPDHRSRQSQNW